MEGSNVFILGGWGGGVNLFHVSQLAIGRHASKCFSIHLNVIPFTSQDVARLRLQPTPSRAIYCSQSLRSHNWASNFTDNLIWSSDISPMTSKANRTLCFLCRNRRASHAVKEQAYKTLVRPQLEYASPVWSPYTTKETRQVEKVQRRAARIVTNRHRNQSNVTDMLSQLEWETPEQRRLKARESHSHLQN